MTEIKRNYLLNKIVDEESLQDIINGIIEVNNYDDKESQNKITYTREPIKLIVDSFGGDCYSGMALVNLIEDSKTPVHTYCYGKAISMGLTIYSVGHKRFAHKRATFMQHQLSGGAYGKLVDITQRADKLVVLQDMLDDVLLDNSNISKEKLKKYRKMKKDWFFNGEEAFKMGLVDELITSRVKRNKSDSVKN